MTLNDYIYLVRNLLHDSQGEFYDNDPQLTTYINIARKRVAHDTAFLRQIVPITLLANIDTIAFPTDPPVYDVLDISVIWGTAKYPCPYMAYSDLNLYFRSRTDWKQLPVRFSVHGRNVILAPIPNQNYESQWDCILTPPDLVYANPNVDDGFPEPYADMVQYWAAHRAYLDDKAYEESEYQRREYEKELIINTGTLYQRRRTYWGARGY